MRNLWELIAPESVTPLQQLRPGKGTPALSLLIFFIFSFAALNCIKEPAQPVAPVWDADLTLPLANRSYTLATIVEKDTNLLQVGVGNVITYSTSLQTTPTYVGDLLTLSPRDTTVRLNLGSFRISPPPLTFPVQFLPQAQGSSTPIPDTTVAFSDLRDTITTFESVTFSNGQLNLRIDNNLPVPIDVLDPVQMLDGQNNIVARFIFAPTTIPANSSRTASDDVSYRTMNNVVRVNGLRVHTPGSVTPVPVPKTDLLVATLTATGIKASQAKLAEIPPQRLVDNDSKHLPLDDSTLVKQLMLRSGRLQVSVTSRINLDMILKFRLNELVRKQGGIVIAYEDSIVLPANASRLSTIDLAGSSIQTLTGDLVRSLVVVSTVILPSGSNGPVTVNDTDKVVFSMTRAEPIIADSAVAVLKPTWVNVNKTVGLKFGDLPTKFRGQLRIPSADLGLRTTSGIGFPTDLYVKIGGRKTVAGDSAFLQIPVSQRRIRPGQSVIQFDGAEVGQFFSQFSGKLPDSLRLTGAALINPPDVYNPSLAGVGSVGRNSSFGATADLHIPLMLGIADGTFADTVSVKEDTKSDQVNDVNSGKMYIEVNNGLPMQVGVVVHLLDSAKRSILFVPQSGQPIAVSAGAVDAQGNVTAPAQSTSVVVLSGEDVRKYKQTEYVSYLVALQTTPGSPAVRFKSTDIVQIRTWSQLSYRVQK